MRRHLYLQHPFHQPNQALPQRLLFHHPHSMENVSIVVGDRRSLSKEAKTCVHPT